MPWEEILRDREPYLVKTAKYREVLRLPMRHQNINVYVKIFYPKSFWYQLRVLFRTCRAATEHRALRSFAKAGIPADFSLGYLVVWSGLLPRASIHIKKEIPNSVSLASILKDNKVSESTRLSLLQRYGQLLAQLNNFGFYVDDFHTENVVVQIDNDNVLGVWSVDHETTRFFAGRLHRWRVKNLVTALYAEINPFTCEQDRDNVVHAYLAELLGKAPTSQECDRLKLSILKYHLSKSRNRIFDKVERSFLGRKKLDLLKPTRFLGFSLVVSEFLDRLRSNSLCASSDFFHEFLASSIPFM